MSTQGSNTHVPATVDYVNSLARALLSSLLAAAIAAILAFVLFGIFVGSLVAMFQWSFTAALVAGSGTYIAMFIMVRRGKY